MPAKFFTALPFDKRVAIQNSESNPFIQNILLQAIPSSCTYTKEEIDRISNPTPSEDVDINNCLNAMSSSKSKKRKWENFVYEYTHIDGVTYRTYIKRPWDHDAQYKGTVHNNLYINSCYYKAFENDIALKPSTQKEKSTIMANCTCSCGARVGVLLANVLTGNTKSCGCTKIVHSSSQNSSKKLLKIFYNYYYKKTLGKEWQVFDRFAQNIGTIPDGIKVSLRRFDTKKLYEPGNVFWLVDGKMQFIQKGQTLE